MNKKEDIYQPWLKHFPFKIKEIIDDTTIIIQSQLIANGTKKGYKIELRLNFEYISNYEHIEDKEGTRVQLNFDPAEINFIEVDIQE